MGGPGLEYTGATVADLQKILKQSIINQDIAGEAIFNSGKYQRDGGNNIQGKVELIMPQRPRLGVLLSSCFGHLLCSHMTVCKFGPSEFAPECHPVIAALVQEALFEEKG